MRDIVPALEHVQPGATRAGVEALHDPLQPKRFAAGREGMRPHRAPKSGGTVAKVVVGGESVENTLTKSVAQRMFDQVTGTGVRDLGPLVLALRHRAAGW